MQQTKVHLTVKMKQHYLEPIILRKFQLMILILLKCLVKAASVK
jgi:hypothetical protein